MTELSVVVELELLLPKVSTTELAEINGTIVPLPVDDVAATVHVILSDVLKLHVTPVAVPVWTMSLAVKLDDPTAPENTAVKFTGNTFTGSDCPDA